MEFQFLSPSSLAVSFPAPGSLAGEHCPLFQLCSILHFLPSSPIQISDSCLMSLHSFRGGGWARKSSRLQSSTLPEQGWEEWHIMYGDQMMGHVGTFCVEQGPVNPENPPCCVCSPLGKDCQLCSGPSTCPLLCLACLSLITAGHKRRQSPAS